METINICKSYQKISSKEEVLSLHKTLTKNLVFHMSFSIITKCECFRFSFHVRRNESKFLIITKCSQEHLIFELYPLIYLTNRKVNFVQCLESSVEKEINLGREIL